MHAAADDSMPVTYETQSSPTRVQSNVAFHLEYIRTLPGILKVVEIILSLLTLICSCVTAPWAAASWAQFQSAFAVISTAIYLTLYVMNLISRLPGPWPLIEFIYYMIFSGCFLITAIAAAAQATSQYPSVGATAFFAFAATAVFAVDTFFHFRAWRAGQISMRTTTSTTANNSGVLLEQGNAIYRY